MLRTSRLHLVLMCLVVQLLIPVNTIAAPKAKLWDKWSIHDAAASKTLDHGAWGDFLRKYVRPHSSGVNRVAYAKVGRSDQKKLNRYIEQLTQVPISQFNQDEQLAYWINLYNALTVKVVLDHYPVMSIRDIKSSFFSVGPWNKKLATVEGEELTLNDIEHRILRPIWKDPRIHYAVNCASIGCPNLQPVAFTGSTANMLLDKAAGEFVNHSRAVSIERGRLVVSSIYVWFQEDFGNSDKGVIEHLQRYANPELSDSLSNLRHIAADRYDWSLNGVSKPPVWDRRHNGGGDGGGNGSSGNGPGGGS